MSRKLPIRVEVCHVKATKSGRRRTKCYTGKIDRRSLPPGQEYHTLDDVRSCQWVDTVSIIVDDTKERVYAPPWALGEAE